MGRSAIDPYIATEVSLKYMPSNFQASLVNAQLNRINELLKIKKKIFNEYKKVLKKNKIEFVSNFSNEYIVNGYWATTIVYDRKYKIKSGDLIKILEKKGIPARKFFAPLVKQNAYKKFHIKNEKFPVAEILYDYGLTLPCHYNLTKKQMIYIAQNLSDILNSNLSE